ncbi:MAG: hypothetical protein PHC66_02515 [Candidatus Nanoarchaeia archaeon]|nr:hypothetical protein [Candidatus Nanoarchaeia archaeon]MDD5239702.1 hypothetical protein [Candidatus Nanoarchaeia archaeon]
MKNIELARTKLERAQLLFETFEEISENELKQIFNYVMNAIELMPADNIDKYELYGQVRNLAGCDIKKFGGIFKAVNWKNSTILRKQDIKEMIDRIDMLLN